MPECSWCVRVIWRGIITGLTVCKSDLSEGQHLILRHIFGEYAAEGDTGIEEGIIPLWKS